MSRFYDIRKECQGMKFRYRIRELCFEIKYGMQRFLRGYDSRDVFCFCGTFPEIMISILKEFRIRNDAVFNGKDENGDNTGIPLSKTETDNVIDEIIFHLNLMDEDKCANEIFRKEMYGLELDDMKKVYEAIDTHKNEAFRLLTKWYWDLWY